MPHKTYSQTYYAAHKAEKKAAVKKWREEHPEKVRSYYHYDKQGQEDAQKRYYLKLGCATPAEYQKALRRARKLETIEMMGGKCVRCGFDDPRALQIDHVHGDGPSDRSTKGRSAYYLMVQASVQAGEGKYQLLCANCNWIKRDENQEYG